MSTLIILAIPCCNACKHWYTDNDEEPCASCTGGITESGEYSNFEPHIKSEE